MYFLTDEACSPLALTEKEYSWMVGQLKKAMTEYIESFGVAGACEKCNEGTIRKMS